MATLLDCDPHAKVMPLSGMFDFRNSDMDMAAARVLCHDGNGKITADVQRSWPESPDEIPAFQRPPQSNTVPNSVVTTLTLRL